MALLGPSAWIGFDETWSYVTEGNEQVNVPRQELFADLINGACEHLETWSKGPIITSHQTEFYYGEEHEDRRLVLNYSPVVISSDPARAFTLKVRTSGDSLNPADYDTWVSGTDYILEDEGDGTHKGIVILNPAAHRRWPDGFRNIYVDYYAGFGDQLKNDDGEVVGSTVPQPIKLAAKKLIKTLYESDITMLTETFLETGPRLRAEVSIPIPPAVYQLMQPYLWKRPTIMRVY